MGGRVAVSTGTYGLDTLSHPSIDPSPLAFVLNSIDFPTTDYPIVIWRQTFGEIEGNYD